VQFTYANPDKAGADIHAMVPEVDAAIAAAQIRSINGLVYNDVTSHDGFGALTPERMALTWKWVSQANDLAADAMDPEVAVNRDFMPEQK
jgi:NitT/TauT family transport system substrate-binding protein